MSAEQQDSLRKLKEGVRAKLEELKNKQRDSIQKEIKSTVSGGVITGKILDLGKSIVYLVLVLMVLNWLVTVT